MRQRRSPRRAVLFLTRPAALWVVLAIAAALRFATLSQQSYWDDEGYTVGLMHMSFVNLFHGIARTESAPPTYYVLAWLWTHVFGTSEYGLRSLSAVAGVGTVAACYAIAAAVASRLAGIVAAAAAAFNPLLIWYSQEARAYALFAFFASLGIVFFVRALDDPTSSRARWGWGLAGAATVATHYFAVFLVVPEAVVLLARARRRAFVWPSALVLATMAAVLPLALDQRNKRFGFAASPLARRVAQVPEQFLVGYGVWVSPLGKLAALLGAASALVAAVLLLRSGGAVRRHGIVLLGLAVFAFLAPVAYAAVGSDYVLTLYFIALLPVLLSVAALGWARSSFGIAAAVVYVLVAAGAEAAVVATPEFQREDIRGVAHRLEHPCSPRAIVISPSTVLSAYMDDVRSMRRSGETVREIDLVAMAVKNVGEHESVPRDLRSRRPAPGFRPAGHVFGSRYTIYVFRAARPQRVTPAALAVSRLGPWPPERASVDVQTCGGGSP